MGPIGPVNPDLAVLAVCRVLICDYVERADRMLAGGSFNLTFQPVDAKVIRN